jgi:hypothetical protein
MNKAVCIFCLACLATPFGAYAQSEPELALNINTFQTNLKQSAVGFAVEYLKPFSGLEQQTNWRRSFLNITPDIRVQEGSGDAFSSIVVGASGFFLRGSLTTLEDEDLAPEERPEVLDASRTWHLFPVSLGTETASTFDFVNVLAEGGYIPYYQSQLNSAVADFFKHTQVGIFLQAGYKVGISDSAAALTGGKRDESEEEMNSAIVRAKATLAMDTKNFFRNPANVGFGFVGRATYWFDALNTAHYYQLDMRTRIYLSETKFFDVIYQKGSGAPNFNQGDQFGAGLTVQF